jgi:hypothetical protein
LLHIIKNRIIESNSTNSWDYDNRLLRAQQERNNVGPTGDNLGDESNPEAIVILDTAVMQRIDDKTNITGNNEVILLITLRQNFLL